MKVKIDNSIQYLFILFILSICVFSILVPDIFWSLGNFQSMASQIPVLGLLTLAMAIPMITGGINLSIIATMNACSLILAYYVTQQDSVGYLMLGLVFGVCCAVLIGLLNGALIAMIKVSPILATLGTMTLINGLNILFSNGSTIANFPSSILAIHSVEIVGIPLPMIIFLIATFAVWFMLEKTTLGKSIYFIGNNERATHYSGINVNKSIILVYVISSLLCVIAGVLMMSKLNSAKASYGDSYLLISILATVLGCVNPDGGKGKIAGIIIALILLQIIESGLNIIGVSSYITVMLWGVLLLFFIFLQKGKLFSLR
ncbi:ABC transporter permease [Conservatibacter flavescens]|uniref:Sugar ABC transporter permease n=1 Tax=Conservatibacter flavescens TaxID=28161 RepID=A0A2M8S2F5_9PAST|nr:ABC transporter permease [Conservatibacter flavescens]PJG85341.1 sugar ABC transporter permease [Conservatibacter flavescens]